MPSSIRILSQSNEISCHMEELLMDGWTAGLPTWKHAVLYLLLLAEAQILQIRIIEQNNEELPLAENTYLAKIFQSWSNLRVISEVLKLLVVYSTAVKTKQNNDNCYSKCNNENHRKQTKLKNEKDFSGKCLIQLEELKRTLQQHTMKHVLITIPINSWWVSRYTDTK